MTVRHISIALAVAATLLAGCDAQAPSPSPSIAPLTSSTERPPPSQSPKRLVVPEVVGSPQRPAIKLLRQAGFAVEVVRRNACPPGVVIAQRPTGRVDRGSKVELVVLDPATASCTVSPATAPAQQLIDWATGTGEAPEFADSVALLLGNSPVQTVADPLDREAWDMCEPYAELSCPLNPLTMGAERQFTVRTVPPGASSCPDRSEPLPGNLIRRLYNSVTLVAKLDKDDACMSVLALQVWVDDDERIEAANLLVGSP